MYRFMNNKYRHNKTISYVRRCLTEIFDRRVGILKRHYLCTLYTPANENRVVITAGLKGKVTIEVGTLENSGQHYFNFKPTISVDINNVSEVENALTIVNNFCRGNHLKRTIINHAKQGIESKPNIKVELERTKYFFEMFKKPISESLIKVQLVKHGKVSLHFSKEILYIDNRINSYLFVELLEHSSKNVKTLYGVRFPILPEMMKDERFIYRHAKLAVKTAGLNWDIK